MWIHGCYQGYGQNDALKDKYSAVTELLNAVWWSCKDQGAENLDFTWSGRKHWDLFNQLAKQPSASAPLIEEAKQQTFAG